jgi:hypothetical protein
MRATEKFIHKFVDSVGINDIFLILHHKMFYFDKLSQGGLFSDENNPKYEKEHRYVFIYGGVTEGILRKTMR